LYALHNYIARRERIPIDYTQFNMTARKCIWHFKCHRHFVVTEQIKSLYI